MGSPANKRAGTAGFSISQLFATMLETEPAESRRPRRIEQRTTARGHMSESKQAVSGKRLALPEMLPCLRLRNERNDPFSSCSDLVVIGMVPIVDY